VDPSGAAVSQECVTLKGAGSTNKAAMFTNFNGEFVFSGLAPGTYDLSFTWRIRSEYGGFNPRYLTVKADNQANVVSPVALEIAPDKGNYNWDALRDYRSKYIYTAPRNFTISALLT
jgi:hypothetical protein